MADDSKEGSFENIKNELSSWASPLDKIMKSLDDMFTQADNINRKFIDGRVRIQEMDRAVANAASGVIRLGGDIGDVSKTITDIAEGSRRNVIATEEQVSKLYASSQLLEIGASRLVESFGQVGYETSQIGPNIENSIGYIQSVGLNAKTVMRDVVDNMGQMNRYQFEGGVAGLTKMAAQASMLRFDMQQTFNLADRVLDPEGAIDVASAFQRLGVSVGDLADPFQLMNQSINDPSGLQNSLAEVSKQFTYFDEETKSFKINPQGVLTLREMEKQTGVSAAEMSKMGLAAAELDKRLSEVSMAGLKFENEEDKQYLANIAKMGKGGKYEVELKDGVTKELQNLNQEEFNELIEQQKKAPKTIEDLERSQLEVLNLIESDFKAIAAKGTFGVASSRYVEGNLRGVERIGRGLSGAIESEVPGSRAISQKLTGAVDKLGELFSQKDKGTIDNASFAKKVESLQNEIKNEIVSLGPKGLSSLSNILQKTGESATGGSGIENKFSKEIADTLDALKSKTSNTKNINSQVDFGGTITVKVDAPPGVSEQQFKTYFESEEFKKMIYKYYEDKAKELQK